MVLGKPRGMKKGSLDVFREDILRLREEGYSYQQIADWLLTEKSVTVNQATISRFCSRQK